MLGPAHACKADALRCGMQVNGQRSMEEVFAEIDGVLSAFTEDDAALQAA